VASIGVALEVEKAETAVDADVGKATVIAAIVVAVVVSITVADVDVVVVAAAVVDAFVVAVVSELAAVQLSPGRLEHAHDGRVVPQSCGFR
jgi:hypothetical protein